MANVFLTVFGGLAATAAIIIFVESKMTTNAIRHSVNARFGNAIPDISAPAAATDVLKEGAPYGEATDQNRESVLEQDSDAEHLVKQTLRPIVRTRATVEV